MFLKQDQWMKSHRISAALVALAAATSGLHAAVVFSEPFDYTPGIDGLNGQGRGTGLSGTWTNGGYDIVAPGLTYAGLITAGNATAHNGGQTFRHLTGPAPASGSIYLSFLLNQESANFANFTLFGSGSELLSFGATWSGSGPSSTYSMYISGVTGPAAGYHDSGVGVTIGTTQFLVLELDYSTPDETGLHFYLNPAVSGTAPDQGDAILSLTATHTVVFDEIRLELNSGTIDELRGATTYAGITGVPEPGVAITSLLGGLFLLRRRSRET